MEIGIPEIFKVMNNYLVYGNKERSKGNYEWRTRDKAKASSCIGCGQCESVCPQHLPIIEKLREVSAHFDH